MKLFTLNYIDFKGIFGSADESSMILDRITVTVNLKQTNYNNFYISTFI